MNKNIIILIILFVLIIILNSVLINTKIEKFYTSTDSLESSLNKTQNDIKSLEEELVKQTSSQTNYNNQMLSLENEISDLEKQIELGISNALDEKERTELETRLQTLKSQKESLNRTIAELESLMNENRRQLNSLKNQIETQENNLKKINSEVENCKNIHKGLSGGQGCVRLYTKKDYKGKLTNICTNNFKNYNHFKNIKSLKVDPGWKVTLYDLINYGGRRLYIKNQNRYLVYNKRNTPKTARKCSKLWSGNRNLYNKCCGENVGNWNNYRTCNRYIDNWNNQVRSVTLERDYNVNCN